MNILRSLFTKKSQSANDIIKHLAEEKIKNGKITEESFEKASEELLNRFFSGELNFEKEKNWEAPEVEIYENSQKSSSPNMEFSVHWQDGYGTNEKWMTGIVVLRKGDKDIWKRYIDRPYACKVANNGTVICNDSTLNSLKYSKETYCEFFSWDCNGDMISKYLLTANVGDTFMIDSNGKIAVFNTLSSTTPDADSYFVFSLQTNMVLQKMQNILSASIDETSQKVILRLKDKDVVEVKF